MKNAYLLLFHCIILTFFAANQYPENEAGIYEDMLTPEYYHAEKGTSFRNQINAFVFFARQIPFQHPLSDLSGNIPEHHTPFWGKFGAGKGPTRTEQHHPAKDIHVGKRETKVNLYAAHEGVVHIFRDAPKYRHYLSITKSVTNDKDSLLGKIVSIYAHLDLDLDSAQHINLEGKTVKKGELISKNLYAKTVGGPHLHFEIRYYRNTDTGDEEFYGFKGMPGTKAFWQKSAGSWTFGVWNPDVAYGYANPDNYFKN